MSDSEAESVISVGTPQIFSRPFRLFVKELFGEAQGEQDAIRAGVMRPGATTRFLANWLRTRRTNTRNYDTFTRNYITELINANPTSFKETGQLLVSSFPDIVNAPDPDDSDDSTDSDDSDDSDDSATVIGGRFDASSAQRKYQEYLRAIDMVRDSPENLREERRRLQNWIQEMWEQYRWSPYVSGIVAPRGSPAPSVSSRVSDRGMGKYRG